MNYFKMNPWLIPMIGGLIALISIFTPSTFNNGGTTVYIWMTQLAVEVDSGSLTPSLWRSSLPINILSITVSLIIFASAIILITLTNTYRKHKRNFKGLKLTWVILASLIIASTLTWIIYMEIMYFIQGSSHWQSYTPHFGVIGPFIGSALIILGAYLIKEHTNIENGGNDK